MYYLIFKPVLRGVDLFVYAKINMVGIFLYLCKKCTRDRINNLFRYWKKNVNFVKTKSEEQWLN